MIRADQIPPEVVEALAVAWRDEMNSAHAIAAALNAWFGATTTSWFENGTRKAVLNIPLPLEPRDE